LISPLESSSKDQASKNLMDLADPPLNNNGELLDFCFLLSHVDVKCSFSFNIQTTQGTFGMNIHHI